MNLADLPIYEKLALLTRASHREFQTLCVLDKVASMICSNRLPPEYAGMYEQLYKERSENFFPEELINVKYSHPKMDWKEFYNRLQNFTQVVQNNTVLPFLTKEQLDDNLDDFYYPLDLQYNPNIYALQGKLLELDFYEVLGKLPEPLVVNYAGDMNNNSIPLLEWFEKKNILPTVNAFVLAAQKDNTKVLNWMEEHSIPNLNYELGVDRAMVTNSLNSLKWFVKREYIPSIQSINIALIHDYFEVVQYALDNMMFNINNVSANTFESALYYDTALLKFMVENNLLKKPDPVNIFLMVNMDRIAGLKIIFDKFGFIRPNGSSPTSSYKRIFKTISDNFGFIQSFDLPSGTSDEMKEFLSQYY